MMMRKGEVKDDFVRSPSGRAAQSNPQAVSSKASIPNAAETIGELLDEAAAYTHHKNADTIQDLLDRLGRDGLSMDEWNTLINVKSNERIEGWRRGQRAAQAIEARRAETETGSVHESAVGNADAPK